MDERFSKKERKSLNPIQVKFESAQYLASGIIAFVGFIVFGFVRSNIDPKLSAIVFLPMLILLFVYFFKILNIVLSRRAAFSLEIVSLETKFGNFQIRTDDILYVEKCAGHMRIGNAQQAMSVPDVDFWSHTASTDFSMLFLKHLASKGVVPQFAWRAFWPKYKNCRIR